MKFVTLDFETYFDNDYSLSKLTTEAYVRDPRFEAIMLGYQIDDDPHQHVVEGPGNIQTMLDALDIGNCACLAHHAQFDGLILSHHFNYRPKVWFDTLAMARGLGLGVTVGGSLGKLLEHFQAPVSKGDFLITAKGKHLSQFSWEELEAFRRYCKNDIFGTKYIFNRMVTQYSKTELKHIDMLTRMFTEPMLELDTELLEQYVEDLQVNKLTHLISAGVTLDEVMSNDKFAEALRRLGVDPPMKISPTTGRPTYAFAKTDEGLQELSEHPDERVQTLLAARLQNKTTINQTRAKRMIEMNARGPACMYYKYAGAEQTMRVAGGDSMNWQNLQRGGKLRDAIYAPEGYVLVVPDSSNVEARVLDWLAMQEDMVQVYRDYDAGRGPDVYCVMATRLFGKEVTEAMKPERQAGKTVKLACGFQMGYERYRETARIMGGLKLTLAEANYAVETYRKSHPMVVQLWSRAQSALPVLATGPNAESYLDPRKLLRVEKEAIRLPNGLAIRYPDMRFKEAEGGWTFAGTKGKRKHIYGGKIVENVVQALAKIVVMDQLLEINDQYKGEFEYQPARMTSHDEGCFLVPESRAEEVLEFAIERMRRPPKWAPTLPVNAKGNIAIRYGDAK